MNTSGLVLFAALGLAPAALLAEEMAAPVKGDPVHGGRVYRLHCASCHGLVGEGDGPLAGNLATKPPNLRDGAWIWARTGEELVASFARDNQPKDAPPMHGRGLVELELRDVAEWLQEPVPRIESFFPRASDYVAHKQVLDEFGLERAEKALDRELEESEKSLMVYAVLAPEADEAGKVPLPPPGGAKKVPEDSISLYGAKPKRKLGYVTFFPVKLDGGTFQIALALDRGLRVVRVGSVPTADEKSDALRRKLEPILESFTGAGGNVEKKPIEPQTKGVKAGKDLLAEMKRVYTLAVEGTAMYAKEEKDRFWADPDAFKFPAAAELEEVKFDFKEKKSK